MKTCTCEHGHHDQTERFPKGRKVIVIHPIPTTDHGKPIPEGTEGTVGVHCHDGRALVRFDPDGHGHTFHFPEDYIILAD